MPSANILKPFMDTAVMATAVMAIIVITITVMPTLYWHITLEVSNEKPSLLISFSDTSNPLFKVMVALTPQCDSLVLRLPLFKVILSLYFAAWKRVGATKEYLWVSPKNQDLVVKGPFTAVFLTH